MSSTTVRTYDPQSPALQAQRKALTSGFKFVLYMLFRLPTAIWWGLRVKSCTYQRSEITLPYGWRTQNPYKSIYFAAQAGAAELSTGVLASLAIQNRGCRISMLVRQIECEFVKKANSLTTYTCEDGEAVLETIQKAIDTGEGHTVTMTSTGVQTNGEVVSQFKVTWSFKVKTSKS
ncbi:MAG: DUF4442 domain-containing protein [Bacteroidota bacterium]